MPTSPPGPPPIAPGRNGRWEKLGTVGVDSASVAICDPAFVVPPAEGSRQLVASPDARSAPYGSSDGVQLWAGFGDGSYEVWGWIADYADPDTEDFVDERVGAVTVVFIDPPALLEWRDS